MLDLDRLQDDLEASRLQRNAAKAADRAADQGRQKALGRALADEVYRRAVRSVEAQDQAYRVLARALTAR